MAVKAVPDEFALLQQLRCRPELFEVLENPAGLGELALQERLRKQFPPQLVPAAFSLQELRQKAAAKFSRAGQMWFDRDGLEQATAETVARHKARRFAGRLWDLCCGIGGDSLGLASAKAVSEVIAVDRNPADCLRTKWNAEAYEVASRVRPVCADVEELPAFSGLVHIDPDRRSARGRSVRLEDYRPGARFLRQLSRRCAGGAIKLSPASNFGGQFPAAEVEVISLGGEAKEATVWFGELHSGADWRATVLPEGCSLAGDPLSAYVDVTPPGHYLYDPDPAVVRAGLVDLLAEQLHLRRLDEAEEYLTSEQPVSSPFVRAFRIVEVLPNNERTIRNYFRKSQFGRVEIKCRRLRVNAEAVRRKLPLPGNQPGVLVYARISGKARAVVCERVSFSASNC